MNDVNKKEEKLTLELLNAIEQQSNLSQRSLSQKMGIALGLTNSYLKRCARKGLVKVSQAPANRYFYYLTPKGFAEKARLTSRYLADSLSFYRQAGDSCSAIYQWCIEQNKKRVLLCGISELSEIALIRAMNGDVRILGIYDPESSVDEYFTQPVFTEFPDKEKFDVCLLTNLNSPYDFYKKLLREIDEDRIMIPDVLGMRV